jgi:hypothetical protein
MWPDKAQRPSSGRAGRNFGLDRQTEPLVLPSEIFGLDELHAFSSTAIM